ncbi:MAG: restriction endonuclease subunit S [Prevotella sp.]|nr:restriction endonuclease subunit S [Prevotella sp.]
MKEGWTYKKLGEVARVQNGYAFDSKLFNENGNGTPLIRIRDIKRNHTYTYTTEDCSKEFFIENGDLLIGMDGDFNVCTWEGGHAYLNQRVCHVIPSNQVIAKFLYYLLPFPLKRINDKTTFATVKHLSSKQVGNIMMPVPSLDEQQRIVERLDAAFENIDKLKANAEKQLAEAQTLFQKSLAKAMEPKEEWEEKKLGDVAEVNRGRSKHRPRNDKRLFGGPYPFIQTGDIRNAQGGEIKDFSQTYSEFGLSQSKLWAKGTICITIAANIGETAILGFDACFPDSIVGIHPDETVLDALFLNYYLLSIKKEIDSQSYGTAQKNINLEVLNNIVMQIPPLAEQQRIVERLDALSENIRKYEEIQRQIISECDALKQALLRKVFE